ncbi:arylsulfatase A [Rhodopirellula maiorica SM1]|uniref:Arylsulfatase A n=1 Tax=Rhodopirellula maiorica SM1 TaxID=1265738 RepID=M5RKF6_9BACT|nr:sulfatase-like hydrolase/transferase [Rhodopirellula maiorica]EMI15847.1 arylsulfatase A [Rhodopirellula maiorica SM1]
MHHFLTPPILKCGFALARGTFVTCWSLVLLCLGDGADAQDRPPNILFLFADDVGQEVLECYGGQSYSTPHLNELSRTGMKFNHAYSMPVCHPSRLTLMSGQYPFRHGQVTWGDYPQAAEAKTFSRCLQRAGYTTGIAGKWQLALLGDDPLHPQRMGFDYWDLFGWHEGPRYYEPMIYRNGQVRDDTLGHYGPDLYQHGLIEFIKTNCDRPFFAYYSMALAHEVTDDLSPPVPHGPFDRYGSYPEMVTELDRAVGRLVAALNALQLREQTLILFLADNGTPPEIIIRAEGEELIRTPVVSRCNGLDIPGGKKQLNNAGTNVPMIANWPGTIRPGQVVNDLVDFSDILPTFLDLAQAPLPADVAFDGVSFADRLRGRGASPRQFAYCEEAVLPKAGGVEPDGESSGLKWVRTQDWKLYNDGRLYHMSEDEREQYPYVAADDDATSSAKRKQLQQAFDDLGI